MLSKSGRANLGTGVAATPGVLEGVAMGTARPAGDNGRKRSDCLVIEHLLRCSLSLVGAWPPAECQTAPGRSEGSATSASKSHPWPHLP